MARQRINSPMTEAPARPAYNNIMPGDPAPWFHQRSTSNPNYAFDTAAGRYIVLCFYGSARDPSVQAALGAVAQCRHFDDQRVSFFGVSLDKEDETSGRVKERLPGIRHFFDLDGKVSRLYGAIEKEPVPGQTNVQIRRFWLVIDPTMRVLAGFPFAGDDGGHAAVFNYLDSLKPPALYAGLEIQAPVLFLPNVFEPAFCERLIALYEADGGEETGFMRDVDGKTVQILDHAHKRRRDF